MVVFTCNNCSESLKKPKVEKHYQTACRSEKNLTCVDCMKDFRGEEYVTHIKCIAEDERYAAKGCIGVKKGEAKQLTWADLIGSIIEKEENLEVPLKNLLTIISRYVNIPRKKQKFINYVTNSFGYHYNKADVEITWDLIQKHKAEQFSPKQIETKKANATNGTEAKEPTKRKADAIEKQETDIEVPAKKKSKRNSKNTENAENTDTNNHENGVNGKAGKDVETEDADDEFSYEDKILQFLTAKKEMPLKKLQKKVLNAYIKHQGIEDHTDKQVKKFTKHLKKIPNVEVSNDLVRLT